MVGLSTCAVCHGNTRNPAAPRQKGCIADKAEKVFRRLSSAEFLFPGAFQLSRQAYSTTVPWW
jgi:hypothetical protein